MARKLRSIKQSLQQVPHQLTSNRLYRLGFLVVAVLMAGFLSWACGSGNSGSSGGSENQVSYTVTPKAGDNGSIDPDTAQTVKEGETASFKIIPDEYYGIDEVKSDCGGKLNGTNTNTVIYTTGAVNGDCTVSVSFASSLDLEAQPRPAGKVSLSWNEIGVDRYNLIYSDEPGINPDYDGEIVSDVESPYTKSGLINGTTYYFVVEAVKNDSVVVVSQEVAATPAEVHTGLLNDTGFFTCGNYAYEPEGTGSGHSNWLACEEVGATANTAGEDEHGNPVPAGQDANFGRDAMAMDSGGLSKLGGGAAGFDFTKLGADGAPLKIQHAAWDSDGDEASGTRWSCVRDNRTGLVWELKVDDDGDKHHRDERYTWDEAGDFVGDVNLAGLCGANDWRLPTVQELLNIVHNGRFFFDVNMDPDFFPLAPGVPFWSSTRQASNANQAWFVSTGDGHANVLYLTESHSVRLVRDGG